ncbi:hypothetical protein SHO565_74400 [Streptomyces sp. HO565]
MRVADGVPGLVQAVCPYVMGDFLTRHTRGQISFPGGPGTVRFIGSAAGATTYALLTGRVPVLRSATRVVITAALIVVVPHRGTADSRSICVYEPDNSTP